MSSSSVTSLRGGKRTEIDGGDCAVRAQPDVRQVGQFLDAQDARLDAGLAEVDGTALARFRPSTVISTVPPRGTPCGETELIVGGVVRLPVGQSVVVGAQERTART